MVNVTIYGSTMDPMGNEDMMVLDLQLLKVDDVQVFCQPMGKDMAFRGKRCENDGKIMGKL